MCLVKLFSIFLFHYLKRNCIKEAWFQPPGEPDFLDILIKGGWASQFLDKGVPGKKGRLGLKKKQGTSENVVFGPAQRGPVKQALSAVCP